MKYAVVIKWDSETDRWFVKSSDIPGLWMESGSFDALLQRIRSTAPELVEFNCDYTGQFELSFAVDRTDMFDVVDHKMNNRHTANGILKDAGVKQKL